MKKIIVPIDFSDTSRDALQFAYELAKIFNASLKLVHVYSGSFSSKEPSLRKDGKSQRELTERLEAFYTESKLDKNGSVITRVKIESILVQGFTVAEIIKEAKSSDAFMIVMGTKGTHDVLEKAIGSISTGVAQRANCPVLLIPEGVKFESFSNIMYASDYESADESILQHAIGFSNIFRAAMHFVHVSEKDEDDYQYVEDSIFEMLFKDGDPAFAFNLVTIPSASVVKGLKQYAEENNIDLMVLVNHHESFLDNILGKSLTKELGLGTKVPLMVYPV